MNTEAPTASSVTQGDRAILVSVVWHHGHKPAAYLGPMFPADIGKKHEHVHTIRHRGIDKKLRDDDQRQIIPPIRMEFKIYGARNTYWAMREAIKKFREETEHLRGTAAGMKLPFIRAHENANTITAPNMWGK